MCRTLRQAHLSTIVLGKSNPFPPCESALDAGSPNFNPALNDRLDENSGLEQ